VNIGGRDRAETLLAGEQRVLEMIAAQTPLNETLDALCRLVEQVSPEWLASILLVDAKADSVWQGAAPTLPGGYVSALDGARIGPEYGPRGLAALGHQAHESVRLAIWRRGWRKRGRRVYRRPTPGFADDRRSRKSTHRHQKNSAR